MFFDDSSQVPRIHRSQSRKLKINIIGLQNQKNNMNE